MKILIELDLEYLTEYDITHKNEWFDKDGNIIISRACLRELEDDNDFFKFKFIGISGQENNNINVSIEDSVSLLELAHELTSQDTDCQAQPIFWQPRSTKEKVGTPCDTMLLFSPDEVETYTCKEYADTHEELYKQFLKKQSIDESTTYSSNEDADLFFESDWAQFAEDSSDVYVVFVTYEPETEDNFSLFKSDVKQFIEFNKHHLGPHPHTYAGSVWRMRKMEKLVGILHRLSIQNKTDSIAQNVQRE